MKIVKIEAQNFMKLRNINLALKDKGLLQVTGKNGAGKSTLLKLVEWLLEGPTSIKPKLKKSVVRNGADRAWGQLELTDPNVGDFIVTRTLTANGSQNLDIFDENGARVPNQQAWLNKIFTGLTFDPLAFAQMDTDEQIEELKRLAHVELDYEALAKADKDDTEKRAALKKETAYLDKQIAAMRDTVIFDGLSLEKIDETAIFDCLNQASATNHKAQALNQAREAKRLHVVALERDRGLKVEQIEQIRRDIEALQKRLNEAEENLIDFAQDIETAEAEFKALPEAKLVDVAALTEELQAAQRTNRAIDARVQHDQLHEELKQKEDAIEEIDTRLKDRDKMRAEAVATAKLPVADLSFDEKQVYFGKLPLANLGEGEQIRISTLLGIAMNPTLYCMCIQHGEALDEDGLKVIEQLAVENDFQILMARVETSGEVGIVIEDGRVATDNYRASYKPTKAKMAQQGSK